jgi:hypothetical protein
MKQTTTTQTITRTTTTAHPAVIRPLLGMTLLLPASYFMLAMLARACFGAREMYVFIAPSFLQSPFHLFAFHKAQLIIGSLVLAVAFNFRARQNGSHWLNTAIVFQATLLLLTLFIYTLIQHFRY